MNNTIKIKVASPLLRPGITITTKVSSKYAVEATELLMNLVREINGK